MKERSISGHPIGMARLHPCVGIVWMCLLLSLSACAHLPEHSQNGYQSSPKPAAIESKSEAQDNAAPENSNAPLKLTLRESVLMALENNAGFRIDRIQPAITATEETIRKSVFDPVFSGSLEGEKLTEAGVKKYYKHPFKIVSQEEINDAIEANAANVVYLHYLWSDHMRMFQAMLIDAEDDSILAVFRPGDITYKSEKCPPAGVSYRERIQMSVKRLKSIK